jgi:hypothetical protein
MALGGSEIGGGVGGLIGGIGVLAGLAGEGGDKYRKQAIEVYKKLKASDFDYRELSAPELRIVAQEMPSLYDAVVPDEVKTIVEQSGDREAQMRALGRTEEVADNGLSMVDRIEAQKAQRAVSGEADRANEAVLRNMAARGQLGAGDELQARIAANQGASDLARDQGNSLVEQSLLRKMAANESAAGQAAGIRGQDVGVQSANANYINNFNSMIANMRTNAAAQNAAAQTAAQANNSRMQQNVANQNEMGRYNTQLQNLTRKNALLGQNFDQQLQIANGLAGAYGGMADSADLQTKNKADALVGAGQGAGKIGGSFF